MGDKLRPATTRGAVLVSGRSANGKKRRFCAAERIDRLRVWSDHVGREFGFRYGVMIKGLMLLSRSVFVIGADGKIRHLEIVSELAREPDYQAALAAVQQAIGAR